MAIHTPMNIQDRINDLLSKGVSAVTFSRAEGGPPMVAATVLLGQDEWHSKTTIEAVGPNHVDALLLLSEKVDHISKLAPPSRLVKLDGN